MSIIWIPSVWMNKNFFMCHFSASERCFESPTPSSLHHSYETLNTLYDTSSMGNDTNIDTCSITGNGSQKMPHRPAPPVPSAKMNGSNFAAQNMSSHCGDDDIQKFDSVSNKKKSRYIRVIWITERGPGTSTKSKGTNLHSTIVPNDIILRLYFQNLTNPHIRP